MQLISAAKALDYPAGLSSRCIQASAARGPQNTVATTPWMPVGLHRGSVWLERCVTYRDEAAANGPKVPVQALQHTSGRGDRLADRGFRC